MEPSKSGVCCMVKLAVILFSVFAMSQAKAEFVVGVSSNSWQELVPIIISNVESSALTSFTGLGASGGYQMNIGERFRNLTSISVLSGTADVHKQSNAVAPRRNFSSIWLSDKVIWRSTRTFTFGPNFVLNNRKMDNLGAVTSLGIFLDIDYEIFQEVRLTQSLGTMSDSKSLAYSIAINRIF